MDASPLPPASSFHAAQREEVGWWWWWWWRRNHSKNASHPSSVLCSLSSLAIFKQGTVWSSSREGVVGWWWWWGSLLCNCYLQTQSSAERTFACESRRRIPLISPPHVSPSVDRAQLETWRDDASSILQPWCHQRSVSLSPPPPILGKRRRLRQRLGAVLKRKQSHVVSCAAPAA